ncbi:MAG: hypothetical protein LIO54_05460 [Oscillospiraceae bacterium]|nr:hypothetical protein [Oscillospiraceae bacterium]
METQANHIRMGKQNDLLFFEKEQAAKNPQSTEQPPAKQMLLPSLLSFLKHGVPRHF